MWPSPAVLVELGYEGGQEDAFRAVPKLLGLLPEEGKALMGAEDTYFVCAAQGCGRKKVAASNPFQSLEVEMGVEEGGAF